MQKKYNTQGNELTDFSAIVPEGPLGEKLARLNTNNGRDPADAYGWMAQTQFLRPPLVQVKNCRNVLIEDVTLINSPFWTVHPLLSDNVVIRNITIDNVTQAGGDSPNTDGIDPESSSNVRILDCHINVGDDCIAIKSGRDEAGKKSGATYREPHYQQLHDDQRSRRRGDWQRDEWWSAERNGEQLHISEHGTAASG